MSRKIFYFVRHGESKMNAELLRQSAEGGLSEKGKEQAKATGQRLKNFDLDKILCSTYERTRETAALINGERAKPLPIEYSELLIERRNPTEIIGKSMKDPEIKQISDLIDLTYHSDDYRFSDEENFLDLKDRARRALNFLAGQPEKRILVVTHGIFLKMLAAYILNGEALTAKAYNLMGFLNTANNASITVAEYKKGWFGPSPDKRWKLVAWDDYLRQ